MKKRFKGKTLKESKEELEAKLKKDNKEYKYIPLKKFGGIYECFSKLKTYYIDEKRNS